MQGREGRNKAALVVLCMLILLFTGCSSQLSIGKSNKSMDLSFWKPNLLYLKGTQCQRLYVEVDTVKGSQPDAGTIESLRQFLTQYCDKPGGIKIVEDSSIPLADVNLSRPELLALKYMSGPDGLMPDSTAYLYVLFYDSTQLTSRSMNPYVRILPYPSAIYIDMSYIKKQNMGLLAEHQTQLLKHEAAHILGLNWSQKANSAWHCPKKDCLMYERYEVDIMQVLTFQKPRKKEFCNSCKKYLTRAGQTLDDTELRFMGPVMVRSEKDYHVLSLPGFVKLHFGKLDSIRWQYVLAQAQIETPIRAAKPDTVAVVMGSDLGTDPDKSPELKQLIATAKNDPCQTVRLGVNMIQHRLNGKYKQVSKSEQTTASWIKQW
jgi:hypothetical protein